MSTRVYLGNGSPAYTPTIRRGGLWTASGSNAIGPLGAKVGASASTNQSASTAYVMQRRHVTAAALGSGSTAGATLDWCIGQWRNVSCTSNTHLFLWVTTGATDTNRGTLLVDTDGAAIANNFGGGGSGVSGTGVALSTVSFSVGDFIIAEMGFHVLSGSGTQNNLLYFGGSGADLTNGDLNVTTDVGWLQFSGMDAFWGVAAATPVPASKPIVVGNVVAADRGANW